MKSIVKRYVGRARHAIKGLADRIILSSMHVVISAERWPQQARRSATKFVYLFNDFAWLMRDFPRVKAYKIASNHCSVIIVGCEDRYHDIESLIISDHDYSLTHLSKVSLWRLPGQTSRWLDEGVDMVVCVLSGLCPWTPNARYAFANPDTVVQVLDLPDPLESVLVGRRMEGNRRWIRKAEKQELTYRVSHSPADLEQFHHEMYVPFIRDRHGDLAHLSSMEIHERFLQQGDLILVSRGGELIGGALVTVSGSICHFIEYGVLRSDQRLLKSGAIGLVIWCSMLWAKENGATSFDLGGSDSLCISGTFNYKSRWGAKVRRHILNSRPNRVFLSERLPDGLRNQLNEAGIISEIDQQHYRIYIPSAAQEPIEEQLRETSKRGLEGVAVVGPESLQLLTH